VVELLATDLSNYVTGAVIPAAWCADSQRPAFSVVSISSSIVDTGIELSRCTHLLPMPMELNGNAC
jgi:hypothetical protein